MYVTENGSWQISVATDYPDYHPMAAPALCLRCGIRVPAADGRAQSLHDDFHTRVGA